MLAANMLREAAAQVYSTVGQVIPSDVPGLTATAVREPVGVVVGIAPWNAPLILGVRAVAMPLAFGNTVVLKASEETPATHSAIIECLIDAGLPKGVVNLVFGDPPAVARRLLASPLVRKVTFTGSTRVGKELAVLAAPNLKRCTFELGGHAPVIVCADGNVDAAVAATIPFKFTSAGQSCIAPSRFYLHRSRYAEFVDKFAAAAKALKVGDGLLPETKMGPLANARRIVAMEGYAEDARKQGASIICGGDRAAETGWFWAPTVLADVPDKAAVMNQEPFGPIAPMAPFDELDEAIDRANRLPYGFAAYGFTANLRTAERLGQRLAAGNIGINQMCPSLPDMPIGGLGDSGYGYEGGREGIEEFLHFKLVSTTF
jgi:succinate-semialdehyde dehydrogenase/glutarate-semialdehyde dehydrogenase